MKVQFVLSARSDFANILSYYQQQGAAEQGRRLLAEIIKKSERLAKHPDSGRIVPEFGITFLRELIYPPFRVVYRRDTYPISIIRVWRSERLLQSQHLENIRLLKGKLYVEDNWKKLRSMEIEENRATYGKRPIGSSKSKKLNSKKYPFFGIRKNDKKSVKQVMKKLRKPRYHDL